MTAHHEFERLEELLLDRALGDLSSDDRDELESLGHDASEAPDDYELAASAIHLALCGDLEPRQAESAPAEPLPTSLRQRLEVHASEALDSNPN